MNLEERMRKLADEHPTTSLPLDATPAECGEALKQVLRLADALRSTDDVPHKSEARNIHTFIV